MSPAKTEKTAIFLGAGASAAEGAPVQSQLFNDYFISVIDQPSVKASENSPLRMKSELAEFFQKAFNINVNVNLSELKKINFPTFEEALGLLDLAEQRREAFKEYELEDFGRYGNRIRLVRQFMVLAMAKAIADSLKKTKDLHRDLLKNLQKNDLLQDTIFVSTNYDILIDNAITSLSPDDPGANLDYGVDFVNFDRGDWCRPEPSAVALYKLHGSLNWLYCASCNNLMLTPNIKGVIDLITDVDRDRDRAVCKECYSIMTPIIVPPTFYKDMSRVFLSAIWNKAENALRKADHIIFCGYSFPDADMHVKYLIKRIQINRIKSGGPNPDGELRFTIINHHSAKKDPQAQDEKSRYQRFLGAKVNFTKHEFPEFAVDPMKFYCGSGLTLI